MSATVSVIIPTFDRVEVLADAIGSVLAQRHPDIEVLVVDDGSSDGTRELVRRIADRDERVRYHHQPNAGAAAARNTGIDVARGEYVAFLDSDDSWQPWHLSLMLAALDLHPDIGLVWSNTDFVATTGAVVASLAIGRLFGAYRRVGLDRLFSRSSPLGDLGIDIPPATRNRRLFTGEIFSAMVMGNLILTSATVMRRTRLDQTGRFDETLAVGEDYDFFMRACRAGPVAYADIADVRYRVGNVDKLSAPSSSLAMGRSYLRVLEETLARDQSGIDLSPRMIARARASAHRWIGVQELLAGQPIVARVSLVTSIKLRRLQPRVVALVALTFLPTSATRRLIVWRRALKGRLGLH